MSDFEEIAWLLVIAVVAGLVVVYLLQDERPQACHEAGGVWIPREEVCLDRRATIRV